MWEIKPIISALLRHRSSTLLIILQIAITLAVLVNAISIIEQRTQMMDRETGLAEDEIFSFNVNAFGKDYDYKQHILADQQLLREIPGVIDAVAINQVPLSGSGDSGSVASSQENFDNMINVGAGFFMGDEHMVNTLGVKIIEGRNFRADEVIVTENRIPPTVVLITKALADKLYPEGNALGKKVYMGNIQPTVIGIIERLSGPWVHSSIFENNMLSPIIALTQFKRYIVRTEPKMRAEVMGKVEKLLLARNAEKVIFSMRSLNESKARSYSGDSAMAKILWVVTSLLIAITALGIVGIVSFNVNQRIKQIGTRRALGASQFDIQRYFITENILLTTIAMILGSGIAIGVNLYLVNQFQLSPIDWLYFPYGIGIMLISGVLAVWMPAKRAANISPAVATQSI